MQLQVCDMLWWPQASADTKTGGSSSWDPAPAGDSWNGDDAGAGAGADAGGGGGDANDDGCRM